MVQDYSYGSYEFADIVTGNLQCAMGIPVIEKDTATFGSGNMRVDIIFFGRTQHCETVCFEFFVDDIKEDRDIVTRFYDAEGKIETCHYRT